jgi:Tol biopolymer transport system component
MCFSGWCLAATFDVVSATDSALGSARSGYVSPWAIAPVSDAGTVVFLSEAPDFNALEMMSGGIDWDVFSKTLTGEVETVSVSVQGVEPDGQAVAVAFAGDDLLEVREEDVVGSVGQQLLWRSFKSPGSFTRLAAGSESFSHMRMGDDGGFAVFAASDSSETSTDSDGMDDIFLQYLVPVMLTHVSVRQSAGDGTAGACSWPDVDASGQNVVFQSKDSRFVEGDTNVDVDVFLWQNGTFSRVNRRCVDPGDGWGTQTVYACEQPVISGDASKVAYVSMDPDIVVGDDMAYRDIFVYDVASGETICVSMTSLGDLARGDCEQPDMNRTGRFVVFRSNASNFPGYCKPDGEEATVQIYLYDLAAKTLECLSLDGDGAGADSDCYSPTISPDGRYVTFSTAAANLVGGSDAELQVIRVDRGEDYLNVPPVAANVEVFCQISAEGLSDGVDLALAGSDVDGDDASLVYRLTSLPSTGSLTDGAGNPILSENVEISFEKLPLHFAPDPSANEGQVIFSYEASDGIAWSKAAEIQITVVDYLGYLQLASVGNNGQQGTTGKDAPCHSEPVEPVSLSDDGKWVAFTSAATNLSSSSNPENSAVTSWNVFYVRNTVSGQTYALEFLPGTASGYAAPQIAGDGSAVVYSDGATLYWMSLGSDGPETPLTLDAASVDQFSISSDACKVVYRQSGQIYLWTPLDDESVMLVSENEDGVTASASCSNPVISASGNRVAFRTKGDFSGSLAVATYAVWIKDLTAGTVERVADEAGSMLSPGLSQTGRYLSYQCGDTALVLDLTAATGSRKIAEVTEVSEAKISADGRYLYLTSARNDFDLDARYEDMSLPSQPADMLQAWRLDLHLQTAAPLSLSQNGYATADVGVGAISATGRYALFATEAANLKTDTNDASDVFLMDLGAVDNEVPTIADSEVEKAVDEDQTLTVSLTATDAENNDLIFEIVSQPVNGTLSDIGLPALGGGSPSVDYTPDTNWNGEDSFTYRCRDAEGYSNTATVKITVNSVNDAPMWKTVGSLTAEAYVGQDNLIDLRQFVDDVDEGDTLTFTMGSGLLGVYVAEDGHTLVLTDPESAGNASFILTVNDGSGEEAVAGDVKLTVSVRYLHLLELTPGWNLVSLPFEPSAETCIDLVDAATGPVWFWKDGAYEAVTEDEKSEDYLSELTYGRGYWFYYNGEESRELSVVGDALPADTEFVVDLTEDWQLLGPVGAGEFAELPHAERRSFTSGDAWEWDGERYLIPEDDLLQAGRGYWLRSLEGTVTVDLWLE